MQAISKNTIFYLTGPPGVGKYSVGKVIAEKIGARFVHNHYWNNVIFRLIEQDGVTPLPDEVFERTAEVRNTVFATMERLSPAEWSFVVTHAAMGEGEEADRQVTAQIDHLATARRARLFSVRLVCDAEELSRRVVSSERRELMKEIDSEAALRNALEAPYNPGIGEPISFDTTNLSAEQAANQILLAADRATK